MVNNVVVDCDGDKNTGEKNFNFLKLFNKKNLKIITLVLVVVIIGLFLITKNESEEKSFQDVGSSTYYTTTLDYCHQLETKLKSVLSSIKGAGNVSVMLSLDGSPELIYAEDIDNKVSSNSSGSTTTSNSSSPIIITVNGSSNALILTESLPQVKGVIVVSSGAGDIGVKLDILNAVSILLDISTDKVSVLKGI